MVDLDEQQEEALNVALNKISGAWDTDLLASLLHDLDDSGFDMSLTGFDVGEISQLFDSAARDVREDDFDVDAAVPEEPVTRRGDIIHLGCHRLMCGDATSLLDVERLMGDVRADMCFTDPPYNVDYEGATKEKLKIQNDRMAGNKFYEFLRDAFLSVIWALKPGGAIYVCHADSEGINFREAFADSGFMLKQCLVWVKNSFVMGRQDYQWQHEPILYGWKPGAAHAWYGGRKQSTTFHPSDGITAVKNEDGAWALTVNVGLSSVTIAVPDYEILASADSTDTSIWREEKPQRNGDHPTMKPIKLCARAIRNSSCQDGIVLDLFGGSGSTLIAADQIKRVCYMVELDPKYCDVIVNRYINQAGADAGVLVERDGKTTAYKRDTIGG